MATDEMKPRFKVGDRVYCANGRLLQLSSGTVDDVIKISGWVRYLVNGKWWAERLFGTPFVFATKEEAVTWFTKRVE